jgi:hypothetical protein
MDREIDRAVAYLVLHRSNEAAMTVAFNLSPVLLAEALVRDMWRPR